MQNDSLGNMENEDLHFGTGRLDHHGIYFIQVPHLDHTLEVPAIHTRSLGQRTKNQHLSLADSVSPQRKPTP